MKQCPKCKTAHDKPGVFCSLSCANSRNHSAETKAKIAKGNSITARAKPRSEAQRAAVFVMTQTAVANRRRKLAESEFDDLPKCAKRARVFAEQGYKCASCELSEWMGKPITLELDHADGNNKNNVRQNLRALCPNCHAQTPTWRRAKTHPNWKLVPPAGIEPALSD